MRAWMGGGAVLALGIALGASSRAADDPATKPAAKARAKAAAAAAKTGAMDAPKALDAGAATASDAAVPLEVTAPSTDEADVAYDPAGKRDPFRPPRANQMLAAGGARTPLQRYELGQLKLVAVIYEAKEPRAVVEDEGGLGYIIKVGTKIGVNEGIVRGIERGRVLVEEESMDFFGERRSSEVVLEMASGERGNR
jgi:type IV pilus assembly protein PilP